MPPHQINEVEADSAQQSETHVAHETNKSIAGGMNKSKTTSSELSDLPPASNGDKGPRSEPVTSSDQHPLTAATLAQYNANYQATILADEHAARARVDAMRGAAHRMGFELPHEDPWTGKRSGEGWLYNQARTYGRFIGPQPGKGKD